MNADPEPLKENLSGFQVQSCSMRGSLFTIAGGTKVLVTQPFTCQIKNYLTS